VNPQNTNGVTTNLYFHFALQLPLISAASTGKIESEGNSLLLVRSASSAADAEKMKNFAANFHKDVK
jgi:hypothetical protein